MGRKIDLTGKAFGRLRAIKYVGGPRWQWLCRCSCGKTSVVDGLSLRRGHTKSCGCLVADLGRRRMKGNQRAVVHGMEDTRLYQSWSSMKARALFHTKHNSDLYEDKGIEVTPLWLEFTEFVRDMGKTHFEGAHLHRIKPFESYNAQNCQWLTPAEHARVHHQLRRRKNEQ